jgi:hypothetical protein
MMHAATDTPICGSRLLLQVNQMLAAKRINFVPAAVEAGLIPLLKDILAQDTFVGTAEFSSLMKCLRLVTDSTTGTHSIISDPALYQSVITACNASIKSLHAMKKWSVAREDKFADARWEITETEQAIVNEAVDAMHTLACLLPATGTPMYTNVHCIRHMRNRCISTLMSVLLLLAL